MPQINQLTSVNIGYDLPFKNYGGSDIAEGLAVKYDTGNLPGSGVAPGVVITSDDTLVIGVAVSTIPAGKIGMVRMGGRAIGISSAAALTVGTVLMTDAAGKVLAQTAGKYQIGTCASTVTAANDRVAIDICRAKNA